MDKPYQLIEQLERYKSAERNMRGQAKLMRYLRENDLGEYLRLVEQRRSRRQMHSKADWEELGDGGYHRKNHGLAEEEKTGRKQSVYERQVEYELSHGSRNEWARGL